MWNCTFVMTDVSTKIDFSRQITRYGVRNLNGEGTCSSWSVVKIKICVTCIWTPLWRPLQTDLQVQSPYCSLKAARAATYQMKAWLNLLCRLCLCMFWSVQIFSKMKKMFVKWRNKLLKIKLFGKNAFHLWLGPNVLRSPAFSCFFVDVCVPLIPHLVVALWTNNRVLYSTNHWHASEYFLTLLYSLTP